MHANQLFTISEAAKEAGTARSTIQRWIKSGRLKKRKAGKVSLRDVKTCQDKQRTGHRIRRQPLLAESREAVDPAAEVRRLDGDENAHLWRDLDQ